MIIIDYLRRCSQHFGELRSGTPKLRLLLSSEVVHRRRWRRVDVVSRSSSNRTHCDRQSSSESETAATSIQRTMVEKRRREECVMCLKRALHLLSHENKRKGGEQVSRAHDLECLTVAMDEGALAIVIAV